MLVANRDDVLASYEQAQRDRAEILRRYRYDRTLGRLFHETGPHRNREAGTMKLGYRHIFDGTRQHALSRVVWLIEHGVWPEGRLFYRDKDRTNTRIDNLYLNKPTKHTAGPWTPEKEAALLRVRTNMRRIGIDPYDEKFIQWNHSPASFLIFD